LCPAWGMPNYDRRDPAKAYDQVSADIRKVMRKIEQQLRVHDGQFREKTENWGFVGDVTEVLKRLQELSDFLDPAKDG
jgi:hypothetical protein